jgi:hypothetical protein
MDIKKKLPFIVLSLCLSISFTSQADNTSEKLPAKVIIGTEYSVDYNNNNMKTTTVNTKANVFDGDFNTFFASYDRTGTWVGLDLGEKHIITKIAFCPRADWNSRLVLGVLEGANNPDFGDAVPLFLISVHPSYNTMTEAEINCSRGFRYVRYAGPNDVRCNIAELAFYGYKGDGDDSNINPLTNLPAVIIHTTNAEDIVEKEKYIKGIVSFIPADGKNIYSDSLDIKGRGNASWGFPKKPYRLKLYNKTKVLGNQANEKNWTLINNYGDKTLMRNLLAFDLSKRLEIPYTPAGQAVNVFLNGEYKGCYQLCDQIEVADERVEVTKMKTADISGTSLTGGYLIEIDQYANQELSWFQSNQYGIPVTVKYPKDDEIVPEQYNYIKSYFEQFLTALTSSDYKNTTTGYRKYLDVETFIRHFLIGELSGNTDTYWSTYMYKDRNSEKFFVGPIWDFDIAYENDNRTYPINNNADWIYSSKGSYAGYDNKGGARAMINRFFTDPAFVSELKATYAKYRNDNTISEESLLQVVDNYATILDQSQKLNFMRWNIMNSYVHQNPSIWGSYDAEVNNVRNFIKRRIAWMDTKLDYKPTTGNEKIQIPDISIVSSTNQINFFGINQPTRIEIINIMGSIIHSSTVSREISVPLSQGVYIARVTDIQGKSKIQKCLIK